jgi:hypothetical protein
MWKIIWREKPPFMAAIWLKVVNLTSPLGCDHANLDVMGMRQRWIVHHTEDTCRVDNQCCFLADLADRRFLEALAELQVSAW